MDAEFLLDDYTRSRGRLVVQGLHDTALLHGIDPRATYRYEGGKKLLVLWGPGHPTHFAAFKRHRKAGGITIAFDMGYWDQGRGSTALGMNRVAVNALHPDKIIMRIAWPAPRAGFTPPVLRDDWRPRGRVVLVGLGPKTREQFGLREGEWERGMLSKIKAAWHGARVVLRPKPGTPFVSLGIPVVEADSIEEALYGAHAVVCRHSNVAVDAIKAGVPAICEDGAAAAVCASRVSDIEYVTPLSRSTREEFLARLAWYQWTAAECWSGAAWPALLRMVEEVETMRSESCA